MSWKVNGFADLLEDQGRWREGERLAKPCEAERERR